MIRAKQILSMVLLAALAVNVCGCYGGAQPRGTAAPSKTAASVPPDSSSSYTDYLNLEGYRPIIKDGYDITLSMIVRRDTIANTPIEDQWMVQFIQQVLGIKLELEELFSDTFAERRNLMFASDDLCDIIVNVGLSENDIVTYGMACKQLLALNDYINQELTPRLAQLTREQPLAVMSNTTPDGNMYTFSSFSDSYEGYGDTIASMRVFYNTNWLRAANVDAPAAVDEYLDMLRAFKQIDKNAVGAAEVTPLISANGHDRKFLFNAFGWIGDNVDGVEPALDYYNKKIVIPCGEPAYADYIALMNTMYTEGLIHPDYFTMDYLAARALLAKGNAGVCADSAPYVSMPESFADYIAATPLASSISAPAVTNRSKTYGLGTFVISAATEYPEVCMRFIDYLYTPEGSMYLTRGPMAGTADTLGLVSGFRLNASGTNIEYEDVINGLRESDYDYRVNSISISQRMPSCGIGLNVFMLTLAGSPNPQNPRMNMSDPDDHYRQICFDAQQGYMVDMLPVAFLEHELMTRASDLYTLIANYARAETARFITGQKSLGELDRYFEELRNLGIDEYRGIYAGVYADFIAGME